MLSLSPPLFEGKIFIANASTWRRLMLLPEMCMSHLEFLSFFFIFKIWTKCKKWYPTIIIYEVKVHKLSMEQSNKYCFLPLEIADSYSYRCSVHEAAVAPPPLPTLDAAPLSVGRARWFNDSTIFPSFHRRHRRSSSRRRRRLPNQIDFEKEEKFNRQVESYNKMKY